MECRKGCGACCIALSISESFLNHPKGKKAGERCKNLDENNSCKIWGTKEYPKTCQGFQAEESWCGANFSNAIKILNQLEKDLENQK
jgi:hypothetical protein